MTNEQKSVLSNKKEQTREQIKLYIFIKHMPKSRLYVKC